MDGRPPVRTDLPPAEPLEAILVEPSDSVQPLWPAPVATVVPAAKPPVIVPVKDQPYQGPLAQRARSTSTADLIDAQRASLSAQGGTAAAFVLGVLGLIFGLFGFWGLPVAMLGVVMGIWGLYSPRRRWALIAMLLCCLGIGLSSYTGVRQLYLQILKSRPVVQEDEGTSFAP